jgi:hypothetical protein
MARAQARSPFVALGRPRSPSPSCLHTLLVLATRGLVKDELYVPYESTAEADSGRYKRGRNNMFFDQAVQGRRISLLRLFGSVSSLVMLAACGSSTPAAPAPIQVVTNTRLVVEGSDSLDVNFAIGTYFTTDRAGVIDVTVDYTSAGSQILVWIARGECTEEQFQDEQCNYGATSFSGDKPRKVSITGAAAGTYTLIVANLGPDEEQISFRGMLTSTGNAARAEGLTTSSAGKTGSYRMRISSH